MADGRKIIMPKVESNVEIKVSGQKALEKVEKALDKISNIKVNNATLSSLSGLFTALSGLKGVKNLNALSNIDFSKFSDLKVSKAALSNLATYLPEISKNVDVSKLDKLSKIDFSNLSNIKISKSSMEQLSSFVEIAKELTAMYKEMPGGARGVAEAVDSVRKSKDTSARESEAQARREEAQAYKALSSEVKNYYNLRNKAINGNVSYDTKTQTYSSSESPEMARRLNETGAIIGNIDSLMKELNLTEEHRAQITNLITDSQNKLNIAEEEHRNKLAQEAEKSQEVANSENTRIAALKNIESALKTAEVAWEKYNAAGKSNKEDAESYAAFDGYITELKELQSEIRNTGEVSEEQRNRIKALTDLIATSKLNIERNKSNTVTLDPATSPNQYAKAMADVTSSLNKATQAQKNFTAAKNGKSSKSYNELDGYIKQLIELQSELKNNTISEDEFRSRLNKINSDLKTSTSEIERNGEAHKTLSGQIKDVVTTFKSWFSMSSIVMALFRELKQGINTSIELNKAFMQLQIVTGATNTEMRDFTSTAYELSKAVGQSVVDVTKSIETFSRLGYNLQDASSLAKYATILSNVAGVDTESATTGLTSVIKGYGLDVSDAEHITDVLIDVGQKYAVSASEMIEAFEKSGAALKATNVSLEKSAGLIAAANASVQNASTVGTALKTVSARIRGSKTDLEELGEDTEELANGFSKYADEIKALSGVDIMVEGSTNQFKDLYQIMNDVSKVWGKLTDTQQARVAEILGGTRQLQVISSILNNWGDAERAYATATNAADVATKANAKYMNTAAARIEQFKSSLQELYNTFFNEDTIKFFVDSAKTIVEILTGVAKLVNGIGGLNTVLVATAGIVATIKINSILEGFAKFGVGAKNVFGLLTNFIPKFREARAMGLGFGDSLKYVGLKASGAQIAMGALTLAVTGLMMIINGINSSIQETIANNERIIEEKKPIIDEGIALSELYSKYKEYVGITNITSEQKEDLQRITGELINSLGDESKKLKNLTEGTDEYNEALKEVISNKSEISEMAALDARLAAEENLRIATGKEIWGTNKVRGVLASGLGEIQSETENDAIGVVRRYMERYARAEAVGGVVGADYVITLDNSDDVLDFYSKLKTTKEALFKLNKTETSTYKGISATLSQLQPTVDAYINSLIDEQRLTYEKDNGVIQTQEDVDGLENAIYQHLLKLGGATEATKGYISDLLKSYFALPSAIDDTISSTDDFTDSLEKEARELKSVSEIFDELSSKQDLLSKIQKEVADTGAISLSSLNSIIKTYPELEGLTASYVMGLVDEERILESLSEAYKNDEFEYRRSIVEKTKLSDTDLNNYLTLLNTKMAYSTEYYKNIGATDSEFINYMQRNYSVDLSNCKSYIEAKTKLQATYAAKAAGFTSSFNKIYDMDTMTINSEEYANFASHASFNNIYLLNQLIDEYEDAMKEFGAITAKFELSTNGMIRPGSITGGTPSSSSSSSSSSDKEETWFEKWYKWHTHQIDMDKETTSDYLQWLIKSYKQAYKEGIITLDEYRKYEKEVQDGQNKIAENAKSAIDKLVDYRIDMIKKDLENQKDALNDRLSALKDFYDKQKEMLKDEKDEEAYLEQQSEKRKKVSDIQSALRQLEFDNSAWAEKRKLELKSELASAQKELDSFEKDRAYELAVDNLDKAQETQESAIQKQIDGIEAKLNDPKLLLNQALTDIKNNTYNLFSQMLAFNQKYGDADNETIRKMWEEAYRANEEYKDLNGKGYSGINLVNPTNYSMPYPGYYTSNGTTGTQTGKTATIKSGASYGSLSGGGTVPSSLAGKKYSILGETSDSLLLNIGGSPVWVKKSGLSGYAYGTNFSTAGLHKINENGDELVFTSADGNTYRMFGSGDKVLNHNATQFLYSFANSGGKIFNSIAGKLSSTLDKIRRTIGGNEISMSPIIIQGNADMKTVSEIRRAQRTALDDALKAFNRLNK